jgi:hypothetical protein
MPLGHNTDRDRASMRVDDSVTHREQLAGPPESRHPRNCNKHTLNGLRHALHVPSESSEIGADSVVRLLAAKVDGIERRSTSLKPACAQPRVGEVVHMLQDEQAPPPTASATAGGRHQPWTHWKRWSRNCQSIAPPAAPADDQD